MRNGWWLAGRTVPSAVASTGQGLVLPIFLATANLPSGKTFDRVFLVLFGVASVVLIVSGWANVRALRRHPGLVREPAHPLAAAEARRLWWIAVASTCVMVVLLTVQVLAESGFVTFIQFFLFGAAMWAFNVLARRAGSVDFRAKFPAGER